MDQMMMQAKPGAMKDVEVVKQMMAAKGAGKGADAHVMPDGTVMKNSMMPAHMGKGAGKGGMGMPVDSMMPFLQGMQADVSASMCIDASASICSMAEQVCANPANKMHMDFCSKVTPLCGAQKALDGWQVSAAVCMEKSMPACEAIMQHCSAENAMCPPQLMQLCKERVRK